MPWRCSVERASRRVSALDSQRRSCHSPDGWPGAVSAGTPEFVRGRVVRARLVPSPPRPETSVGRRTDTVVRRGRVPPHESRLAGAFSGQCQGTLSGVGLPGGRRRRPEKSPARVAGSAPDDHACVAETHRADVGLLDALGRYLALADSPLDAKVLAPLVSTEIHYRLLVALSFGGMLHVVLFTTIATRAPSPAPSAISAMTSARRL